MFYNINTLAGSATLLKRDSDTGVFLWNLQNFYEHLFYRTPPVAASGTADISK